MKKYELTVVIHPDLEMNITPATDKVEKLIKDNGGEITKEANEGKKRLAYPVEGQEFAIYYYYEVELPPEAPMKISNVLNITDEVIRYLLVKVDPRKVKLEAKRKAQNAAEGEPEESEQGMEVEEDKTEERESEQSEQGVSEAEQNEQDANEEGEEVNKSEEAEVDETEAEEEK